MASVEAMTRNQIRKLARRGKLIDETFKVFQRTVYPGAPEAQVREMRVCFFAGAAELFALMNAGLDDGVSETDGDLAFMQQWVNEIERFHRQTVATASAKSPKS